MESSVAQTSSLATQPVSADAPTGAWVRYEPEFEALKLEIDKIAAMRSQEVDWGRVITLSTGILERKSKDLLVASYLCAGLLEKQGLTGLAEGLDLVASMTTTFWDGLFPETKRMRARISAVEWLVERLAGECEKRKARPADLEVLKRALDALARLEAVLEGRAPGEAPSLGELKRALAGLEEQATAAAAAPPPAAEAGPAAPPRPGAASPAEAFDLSTPQGLEKALDKTLSGLRDIADGLRAARPQDPAPYRIARFAAWLPLEGLPPHKEGKTQIPPMGAGPQSAERFEALMGEQDWAELLEQAERQFEDAVLWLDAQRFVCEALKGLGDEYEPALQVVTQELAGLLRRFPGLADLRFANDTPFADDATRAWIQKEVVVAGGENGKGAAAPAAPADADPDEELTNTLKKVRSLSKSKLPQAVTALEQILEQAPGRRRRFQRRLALARFLVQAKQPRVAVAHLETLRADIARFGLDEWEPGLASEVLTLLVSCHDQLLRGPWKSLNGAEERAEEAFQDLARLHPTGALGPGGR